MNMMGILGPFNNVKGASVWRSRGLGFRALGFRPLGIQG